MSYSLEPSNTAQSFVIFNELTASLDALFMTPTVMSFLDGMAVDKPDMTIVDDGGLQMDIEKVGGGDMVFLIGAEPVTLDCTTGAGVGGKARVGLTAGADANNPVTNHLYVTGAAGVATLVASTSLPAGEFGWIGKVSVPDATTWAATGAYLFQRYTEALLNDSRGALSHEREKLRALGAIYSSGVTHTVTITGGNVVHLEAGSGVVYQLHRQTWPAITTGPYYYGNTAGIYDQVADLSSVLTDSTGSSMSGSRFNLVIWGAVNISTGLCKLFVNAPNGSYSKTSDALIDSNNTADLSVPDDMRSVAFLIARVVLSHSPSGGGTWTELEHYSLLGVPVGVRAGGSGAVASNEFDDSLFRIYEADKEIAFEATNITAATTRTITMPDEDVVLVDRSDIQAYAAAQG